MPYLGSKNAIAADIVRFLPAGKRLVDLFGGGGAVTHAAYISQKWATVLYNDYNSFVVKSFTMAIKGEFRNENRWISREDFERLKNIDPYVSICFSFGNAGRAYCYAKEIEPWKKALHYARVYHDNSLLKAIGIDSDGSRQDIQLHFEKYQKIYGKAAQDFSHFGSLQSHDALIRLESLERLLNLQRLQSLESLQRLQSLEITNDTYLNYDYRDGDVVYCDPPYEGTNCGSYDGFNSEEFYSWVESRDYDVYFSSYESEALNKRFTKCWEIQASALNTSYSKQNECIFTNNPNTRKSLLPTQLNLFDFTGA